MHNCVIDHKDKNEIVMIDTVQPCKYQRWQKDGWCSLSGAFGIYEYVSLSYAVDNNTFILEKQIGQLAEDHVFDMA